MRLPEHSLRQGVQIKNQNQDPVEFPSGTLVFPFWNETLLPPHRREELKEAKRYAKDSEKMIMCIIGSYWLPIPEHNIRKGI